MPPLRIHNTPMRMVVFVLHCTAVGTKAGGDSAPGPEILVSTQRSQDGNSAARCQPLFSATTYGLPGL